MRVRFSKLNIVSKIPELAQVSPIGKCKPSLSLQKAAVDCYKQTYSRKVTLNDVLNEACGILSTEEIDKIAEMEKTYSKLAAEELYNLHQSGIKSYLDDAKAKLGLVPIDEYGKDYTFNQLNLTPEYQTELRSEQLSLIAMRQALKKYNQEELWSTYTKWFDCDIGIPSCFPSKTTSEHPSDKILRQTGMLNSKDIEEVEDLIKKYKNLSVFQIFEEKSKVLEKMQQYFSGKNSDLIGQYSDNELTEMKKLVREYTALNSVQTQLGYFSKHLETLLYSSNVDKIEPNEYIEGIGLIVDRIKVDGIDGIISFVLRDNEYMLRLYDKSLLEQKNNFLKSLPETICLDDLNDINQIAKGVNIVNSESKGLISEIRFKIMDRNAIGKFFDTRKENKDKAYEIMGDNKYSYLIMSFRNFYKERYKSPGKVVGIKLLKLLKDTDNKPVFLIASPYESKHSPVSMYLRMGFKPLFKTEDDVYAAMSKHCEYMDKEQLVMYAKNLSVLGDRIDALNRVYFSHT